MYRGPGQYCNNVCAFYSTVVILYLAILYSSIFNNLGLENTIPGNTVFLIQKSYFMPRPHSLVT
jgi:hypothetical protein